jgi:hypothetical protein
LWVHLLLCLEFLFPVHLNVDALAPNVNTVHGTQWDVTLKKHHLAVEVLPSHLETILPLWVALMKVTCLHKWLMDRNCVRMTVNFLPGHTTLPTHKVFELEFERLMKKYCRVTNYIIIEVNTFID